MHGKGKKKQRKKQRKGKVKQQQLCRGGACGPARPPELQPEEQLSAAPSPCSTSDSPRPALTSFS